MIVNFNGVRFEEPDIAEETTMSENCMRCGINRRTGPDLYCDDCRASIEQSPQRFGKFSPAPPADPPGAPSSAAEASTDLAPPAERPTWESIPHLTPRNAETATEQSAYARQRLESKLGIYNNYRIGATSEPDIGAALVDAVIVELMNRGHERKAANAMVGSYLPRKLADLVEADWREDFTREANQKQWDKNHEHT